MKKKFKMENLDCANCAAKMEDGIRKLDGVIEVNMNFMTQKLTIEAEDDKFEDVVNKANEICKKIHHDTRIVME